jgi:Tfp pilus assembly protein PilF
MAKLPTVLLAVALGAVAMLGADTGWTRATTPHFVVSGDAPAAAVGQLAARLESLRGVLLDAIPRVNDRSLQPAFVVVFGSDRALAPFQPAGVTVGGFALLEPHMPGIVLRSNRGDPRDDAFRTVVHEYVHVLADEPWLPLWLIEGLADYYSVTTLSRDRRRASVGDRIPEHVAQAQRWWVPLRQVLDRPRTSPLANDDSSLSFYAESWLLVHYLMRATPEKGSQLARFIDLLSTGTAEDSAFEQAIGTPAKVETSLRRYLGNSILYGEERRAGPDGPAEAPKPRPMTAAEVDATVGRLLFHLRRDDEADARLNAALGADETLAEGMVTLGALRLRQGRRAEALAWFRRALAQDPTLLLAAYHQGRMALEGHPPVRDLTFDAAYAALSRASEGRGWLPAESLATLGTLAGRVGQLGEAERLLRQAAERSPVQTGTRLELANVCLRVEKFQEARVLLSGLAAGADPVVAQTAQRCLGWLGLAEARATLRAELAAIAGLPDAGPDGAIARTGVFPSPPRLRTPGAGEERRLGLIDAVDCPGSEFIARVSTLAGPVSLSTASLAGVHLSSARDDVKGALPCGPRNNREPVYVTWKGDHRLVALEFLPEDLKPGASAAPGNRRPGA